MATRRVEKGDASDAHDAGGTGHNVWVATLREARALIGAITVMIAFAGGLCIAAVLCLYLGPSYTGLFLTVLCLAVTFSFATSAGITRVVLLVVPAHIRPFALGLMTLLLHGLGDVPSPSILGLLVGAWAPDCSIVNINTTTGAIIPNGGEPEINPHCAANATAGSVYSEQQNGMIGALLVAAVYMLTSVGYWSAAWLVLTRRMLTETNCPPLAGHHHPCPSLDRGSVDVS